MVAFPDGIPGGWDSQRRIHFIGHSMGVQTVRYLQYLLSIDYFSRDLNQNIQTPLFEPQSYPFYDYSLKGCPQEEQENIVDRSNYVASITSLNGMMNGGTGPQCPDMDNKSLKCEYFNDKLRGIKSTWLSHGFMRMMQIFCIMDNLNFTKNGASFHSNGPSEIIKK